MKAGRGAKGKSGKSVKGAFSRGLATFNELLHPRDGNGRFTFTEDEQDMDEMLKEIHKNLKPNNGRKMDSKALKELGEMDPKTQVNVLREGLKQARRACGQS